MALQKDEGVLMSNAILKKFMALYLIPTSVIDAWVATDPAKRKAAEDDMKDEWHKWMAANAKAITSTEACGKTKSVTSAALPRPGMQSLSIPS